MEIGGDVTAGLDVPQVDGQHRNHALATARHTRAVELALQGHSYQAIADQLGYANRGTVHRIVKNALAEHADTTIDEHRQLAVARLDALLWAVWEQAMAGDTIAVAAALKIVTQQAQIQGLYPTGAGRSTSPARGLPTHLKIDDLTARADHANFCCASPPWSPA